MKLVVLYHPKSDHGGIVEDYAQDYLRSRNKKLELVSLETRDGAATATLYDVTQYPAILAMAGDGSLQYMWQGMPLPQMSALDPYSLEIQPAQANAGLAAAKV